ncbi:MULTISPECIES: hypothetical protein [unclassified Bacillus (in: firmicutes)]
MKLDDYYGILIDTMLNRMMRKKRGLSKRKWFGIREALKYILDNYQGEKFESFKIHVRNVIKNMIAEEAGLGENCFLIVGSVGQGKCAEIPRYLIAQAFEIAEKPLKRDVCFGIWEYNIAILPSHLSKA